MQPLTIFLVPYRDRQQDKKLFDIYFKKITQNKYSKYNKAILYYVNQSDNRPFNRGAIKNIGAHICNKLYKNYDTTLVFHDIDNLLIFPELYSFTTSKNIIKHYYGSTNSLGGIFVIKLSDFLYLKGFCNNWGWGYEDNVLYNKALEHHLMIDRTEFIDMANINIADKYIKRSDKYTTTRDLCLSDIQRFFNNTYDNCLDIKAIQYNIVNNQDTNQDTNQDMNQDTDNIYIINVTNFLTRYNPDKKFLRYDLIKNGRGVSKWLIQNKYIKANRENRFILFNI